jgi:hypothetical protein
VEGDGISPWPHYSYIVTKTASSLIVIKIGVVKFGTYIEACHIHVHHNVCAMIFTDLQLSGGCELNL